MKPRTLAVLAAVVAALAAFIFFFEKDLPSSEERAERAKKAVDLAAAEVTRLEIDWSGKRVRFEREDPPDGGGKGEASPPAFSPPSRWRLVEPLRADADSATVRQLVEDLVGLSTVRALEGAAAKDVGLEPPRGTVTLGTAKREAKLAIGGAVPASANVVVQASGHDGFLVVPGGFVDRLARAPGDWRSRDVVTASRDEIERVTLKKPGATPILLAKRGETQWIESPIADVASRDLADRLFGALTGTKIEKFLDDPVPPATATGLDAPAGTIELVLKGKSEPLAIAIGGAVADQPDWRYLRAGGQTFESAAKLAEFLDRPPADWRSPAWATTELYGVERFDVEDAGGKTQFSRSAGDWLRDGKKIPYTPVSDLLYAVTSAKAERVSAKAEAAPRASGAARLTVRLFDKEGKEETLVLFPPDAHGAATATTSAREVVLDLPANNVSEVLDKLAAVRKAEPVVSADEKEKPEKSDDAAKKPD